ncbi:MAG: LysM peptidoglycan-binding domain-containing protein [Gemmatimonadaceae bacterium]|nr:LysM peptidoglycan-binding domain-containing protein [Gemmatimonadaceae bacterium]
MVPRRDVVALAREVPNPSIERYPSRTTAGVTRHTVTRGQTLGAIAQRYHTSVATLKRLNGLKSDNIRVGQRLIVSARAAAPAKRSASKSTVAKKPVAKKPVAKKPVAKKPVAKKPAATKSSSGAKKPGAR